MEAQEWLGMIQLAIEQREGEISHLHAMNDFVMDNADAIKSLVWEWCASKGELKNFWDSKYGFTEDDLHFDLKVGTLLERVVDFAATKGIVNHAETLHCNSAGDVTSNSIVRYVNELNHKVICSLVYEYINQYCRQNIKG